jgi:hypothetical protein
VGKEATGKWIPSGTNRDTSLAQPPDIAETFVREVDENLRRDQLSDFFKRYGVWLGVALVLFLAASAGFIWWQEHRHQRAQAEVEQLATIYKDIGSGHIAKVTPQLDTLANSGNTAVRASALFTRAALAIQENDPKLAIAKYAAIVADDDLPKPYRDAATIRQTALEFDQLDPQQVIARLEPLAKPGEPWFGSAGEMTALALVKQGKNKQAGELFASLAKDKSVPESIRNRSIQIAGTLGVDASAALESKAQ